MPVFYDIEDYPSIFQARMDTAGLTKEQYTNHCLAFCRTIEQRGYKAGVYANKYWLESKLDSSKFSNDYAVWLAHYTTQTTYAGNYTLWQTSESSSVDGVRGNCDFDYFYAVNPDPVSNVKTTVNGSTVSFSFDKDLGMTGYEVYRYSSSGAFQKKYDCTVDNVSVSGLSKGSYKFKIYPYYIFNGKRYKAASSPEISATVSGSGTSINIPSTEIEFDTYMLELTAGTSKQIKATMLPSNTTDKITWTSSNTAVATVSSNGTVTAKSAGNTNITGKTTSGFYATCAVFVTGVQSSSISLNLNSIALGKGETYTLKATVSGTSSVTYSSSNTSVVTVSSSGKLTAKNTGSATITASVGGAKATCKVTVKSAPTSISLGKTSLILGVGETYDFGSTLNSGAESYSRLYSSSDSSIVSTTKSGGVTTANKVGTATITVTCFNGVKATCKITIRPKPTEISLGKTSLILGVGEKYNFDSRIGQGTASYTRVYTSSDSSVASVAASGGAVTAKAVGTTTITVTCYNGVKATCKITVRPAPTEITLGKTSLILGVGEKYNFDSRIGQGTASYTRDYTSSDPSVASVAASGGAVTAKAVGTTTITVTCYNGVKATCKITVRPIPTELTLNKTTLTLGIGEQFDFESRIGQGTASYTRDYTSSNTSVVSVAKSGGLATAKKSGTAIITVTCYNGVKATCEITVKSAPTSITLNKTSITLGVGEQFDLNSTVNSGAGCYQRYFSTNNSSVASVQKSGGLVTAKEAGVATVTVTCFNGVKATCKITVKPAPLYVSLNATKITLKVGQQFDLNSSVNSGAGAYNLTYSSNNTSVASVAKAGGLVTANKKGTAVVTLECYNGLKATCTVTVI